MKPKKVAEQALFSCMLNQEEIRLINQSLSGRGFHYVLHPRAFHHHHLFRDQPKNKQWGTSLSTSLPLHPTLDILQIPLMSDFFVRAAPFANLFVHASAMELKGGVWNTRLRNTLSLKMSDPQTTIQAHILQYIATPVQQGKHQGDNPYR
jgi:hypothetical protein